MTTSDARAHVHVSGLVQGVFFRAYTQRTAHDAGVAGWVRNLGDGRVEAVFEGPRAAVEAVVAWCDRGSPHSRVDSVEVAWEDPVGEAGFVIRR